MTYNNFKGQKNKRQLLKNEMKTKRRCKDKLVFVWSLDGTFYMDWTDFENIIIHLQGSVLTFRHVKCTNSQCSILAMDDMRELVDDYQFRGGGTCFVYSNPQYMFNETNKVCMLQKSISQHKSCLCGYMPE